jgi:uncharacterized protein
MILNTEILDSGINKFSFKKSPASFPELVSMMEEGELKIVSDITADLSISEVAGTIEIKGVVTAELELQCSRCLKTFPVTISEAFELNFYEEIPVEDDPAVEQELVTDDLDREYYTGTKIDLVDYIQEQVLLAVPFSPQCSPACKGLCPDCGADLNAGVCKCAKITGHPAFDVLKNLKL